MPASLVNYTTCSHLVTARRFCSSFQTPKTAPSSTHNIQRADTARLTSEQRFFALLTKTFLSFMAGSLLEGA